MALKSSKCFCKDICSMLSSEMGESKTESTIIGHGYWGLLQVVRAWSGRKSPEGPMQSHVSYDEQPTQSQAGWDRRVIEALIVWRIILLGSAHIERLQPQAPRQCRDFLDKQ
jgi:hypothetical protein